MKPKQYRGILTAKHCILTITVYLLFCFSNAVAEIPQIDVTPTNNVVNGFRFNVFILKVAAFVEPDPQIVQVVVAITASDKELYQRSLHLEVWEKRLGKKQFLASAELHELPEIPYRVRKTLPDSAATFCFDIKRELLAESWVSILAMKSGVYTLCTADWLNETGRHGQSTGSKCSAQAHIEFIRVERP
jgi:hypothetical protein